MQRLTQAQIDATEAVLGRSMTLTELLNELGMSHHRAPDCETNYTHIIVDRESGMEMGRFDAFQCWGWLKGTGRIP